MNEYTSYQGYAALLNFADLAESLRNIFPKADLIFHFDAPIELIKIRHTKRGLKLNEGFYDFLSEVRQEFFKNLSFRQNVIKVDTAESPESITHFVIQNIKSKDIKYECR